MYKIKTSQPEVLWNSKCILGEGVIWVKEHNSLYYVDIKGKKIFKLNYKNKNKSAQEAHEAVRPTDISVEDISSDYDQQRLYQLIWRRTISSQMSDAQIERTVVNINSNSFDEIFIARGEVIKFDGFLRVYIEGTDDETKEEKDTLPQLNVNENLDLININFL